MPFPNTLSLSEGRSGPKAFTLPLGDALFRVAHQLGMGGEAVEGRGFP